MVARNWPVLLKAFNSSLSLKAASVIKVSYIMGSYAAFFSASCIAMPLVGAFGGRLVSVLTCIGSLLLGSTFGMHALAHHVPGLCAAFYWTTQSFLLRVGLPALCFFLFIIHPIGYQAMPYACYWFIPMALFIVKRKNLFLEALGSTFIAHAVGSVIWLYTTPMQPQAWLALLPLVAVERLVFATGMVIVHTGIVRLKNSMAYLPSWPRIFTVNNPQ